MSEESNKQHADWAPLIVVIFVALVSGWLGFELGKHRTRCSAVVAGAGEFYLAKPLDQSPTFRWKTNLVNLKP